MRREPRTLLQRMGFADPDLGDPLHDELIHWIDSALADYRFSDLDLERFRRMSHNRLVWKKWEYPVKSSKCSIAGFVDICAGFESDVSPGCVWKVGWEAKVNIFDLGSLFRQLSVYRAFNFYHIIVVCLADLPERSIQTIIGEGYGFLKPCLDLQK